MHARAYLRASTSEQDAGRATRVKWRRSPPSADCRSSERMSRTKAEPSSHGRSFSGYSRNSKPGDVLLVEQVDRLSRLTESDWLKLRAAIEAKQVRVVALDLPTSWQLTAAGDEFTRRMFAAINGMMLDMLAAVAARITRIVAVARRKGSPRRRPKATIEAVPRTQTATLESPECCARECRGQRSKPRPAAAERQSPRSPSGKRLRIARQTRRDRHWCATLDNPSQKLCYIVIKALTLVASKRPGHATPRRVELDFQKKSCPYIVFKTSALIAPPG